MLAGTGRMGETTPLEMVARTGAIPGSLFTEAMAMDDDGHDKVEYFFNTRTQMVEKGRQSSWEHLMGPYDSPEEAANAMEIARKRSQAWDDDDRSWKGEEAD
jgi:hypothetical protein